MPPGEASLGLGAAQWWHAGLAWARPQAPSLGQQRKSEAKQKQHEKATESVEASGVTSGKEGLWQPHEDRVTQGVGVGEISTERGQWNCR